jgi:inorganic triphosphatase YgiF
MARETELKLALARRDLPRLLAHPLLAACAPQRSRLRNTYFDTPDLALLARRMAVRERQVGRQTLLTVKTAGSTAGGLSRRGEWEAPTTAGAFGFATLVDDAALAAWLQARAGRLVPVFRTDFTRRTWLLALGGARIELALDQGTVASDTPHGPRRQPLLELELELLDGPEDALFALAATLGQAVPLYPHATSKAARGYALFAPDRAAPPAPKAARLTAHTDARRAFVDTALGALGQLQAALPQAATDAEALHQARVALRRLRVALGLFAPVLPAPFVAHWRNAWRALARQLGPLRERDVLAQALRAAPLDATDPALARVLQRQARGHAAARRALAAALREPATPALLVDFVRAVLALPAHPESRLDRVARRWWRARRRRLRAALEGAHAGTPAARHALRLAIKKLRYGLELLDGALPDRLATRATAAHAALVRAQTVLGRLQDADSARRLLGTPLPAPLERVLAAPQRQALRQLPGALRRLQQALAPRRT